MRSSQARAYPFSALKSLIRRVRLLFFIKTFLFLASISLYSESSEKIAIKNLETICVVDSYEALKKSQCRAPGIHISDFPIPGGEKKLRRMLSHYLNRPCTVSDLSAIKRAIILYYRDQHHPLLTVQIPPQDVTEGKFTLIIQESRLGKVHVMGNRYFSKERYAQAIQIQKGEAIDESLLLKNLDFLNRNSFRQVDVIYAPGSESQTTDLELIARDAYPLNAYAGIDNTGLVHTDRLRWFVGATWANAFHCDQILSFQYTAAPNIHKFEAITGSWTIPLPIQHMLLFFGGYSKVHAHVDDSTRTHGTSGQASVRYTIPLSPSTFLLQETTAGFDFKRSNNTLEFVETVPVIGQEVNLTQFMAAYNLGFERDRGKISHKIGWDLQLFFSPFSWLPQQSQERFRSLNPFADHVYVYGRSSFNYKLRLPHEISCSLLVLGQLSNQPLLPSEQLGLGGFNTVRGYEERQLNTDDGVLVNFEILSPSFTFIKRRHLKDGLKCLAFIDYGWGYNKYKDPDVKQSDYLLGVGPGIRYALSRYFAARLDWGIKLHRSHFPGGWSMVHFSVMGSF